MSRDMRRLLIGAALMLAAGCDSHQQPTAPGVPNLSPAPAPRLPVAPANVVMLSPPAPPASSADPIVGRYDLLISILSRSGLRCETVPESATRRRYTADIEDLGDSYAVKLYDATFLRDAASVRYGCVDRRLPPDGVCHQFLSTRDGGSRLSMVMTPEDDWRGSEIWEVLPDGYLLQIHGNASASIRSDGVLFATGSGGLWYGNGLPAGNFSTCGPGDLALFFERRP